jgi:ATP-dependent DNA ligase
MTLPLKQPYLPMEAKSVEKLPSGDNWQYEPKWDGFAASRFATANALICNRRVASRWRVIFLRSSKPARLKAKQFVIDGEIVVPVKGKFSFDDLLMRIHPAASSDQEAGARNSPRS